ncbi:MAG TPA: hypothetical protein VF147_04815 [Vicinamibacterales bacterium]
MSSGAPSRWDTRRWHRKVVVPGALRVLWWGLVTLPLLAVLDGASTALTAASADEAIPVLTAVVLLVTALVALLVLFKALVGDYKPRSNAVTAAGRARLRSHAVAGRRHAEPAGVAEARQVRRGDRRLHPWLDRVDVRSLQGSGPDLGGYRPGQGGPAVRVAL